MLTSNEEISKIEKTYLLKHRQVFLVPDGEAGTTKASAVELLRPSTLRGTQTAF